jgi:hypothetical protein
VDSLDLITDYNRLRMLDSWMLVNIKPTVIYINIIIICFVYPNTDTHPTHLSSTKRH